MPELRLPDVALHFEKEGTGPPLLLLAGMISDNATWAPLLPELCRHFTVIRPDNRSAGRTAPWDAPASVQACADDASALMEHLGFETYHVAGHSMGGLIALEIAGKYPRRVSSLSVLASAPVRSPRTMAIFENLRDIRREPNGETLWLRALYPWVFRPNFFTDPGAVEAAVAAARSYPYAQSLAAMTHQIEVLRDYRPSVRLSEIAVRTLALHAADDILVPREAAEEALKAIRGVTQITIPDAAHSIHWDAPDAVSKHLVDFCLNG